jgi:hypothetical protein
MITCCGRPGMSILALRDMNRKYPAAGFKFNKAATSPFSLLLFRSILQSPDLLPCQMPCRFFFQDV